MNMNKNNSTILQAINLACNGNNNATASIDQIKSNINNHELEQYFDKLLDENSLLTYEDLDDTIEDNLFGAVLNRDTEDIDSYNKELETLKEHDSDNIFKYMLSIEVISYDELRSVLAN